MIDKLQLTLYEFFGYLLPGGVAVLALCLGYWALCIPQIPLPIHKFQPGLAGWSMLAILSYLVGHTLQGIGNILLKQSETDILGKESTIPTPVIARARDLVASQVGIKTQEIDNLSLVRFADEIVIQKGATTDRDVFIYREGFYRGCTIGFALLSLALIVRAFYGGTPIQFPKYTYYISPLQILFAAAIAAIVSIVSRQRFVRFGRYRVSRALYALLASSKGN